MTRGDRCWNARKVQVAQSDRTKYDDPGEDDERTRRPMERQREEKEADSKQ